MCCATQELHRASSGFVHGPVTRYGNAFQRFRLPSEVPSRVLQPRDQRPRFGLFRFRSPLLTESHSFSFPLVTEMFHFTRYRVSIPILFRMERSHITGIRLPHSEISGLKRICRYPKLIAAYHVLHRLLAPRHPPYALNSLFQLFLKLKKAFGEGCLIKTLSLFLRSNLLILVEINRLQESCSET